MSNAFKGKPPILIICLAIISLLAISVISCKKNEVYPIEPSIEFNSIHIEEAVISGIMQKLLVIAINYRDGDGDIGFTNITPGDDSTDYNLYIKCHEFKEGRWQELRNPADGSVINFYSKMISITPEGNHKAIRGVIEHKIEEAQFAYSNDTLKFQLQIVDRAGHLSNVVETAMIDLNRFD